MPSSHPDSSGSPLPPVMPSPEEGVLPISAAQPRATRLAWRNNVWLFLATVASTFITWMGHESPARIGAVHALEYTAALMSILLAHEFGHYVAARIHRVDASLPYFIPLPLLSPFGTM